MRAPAAAKDSPRRAAKRAPGRQCWSSLAAPPSPARRVIGWGSLFPLFSPARFLVPRIELFRASYPAAPELTPSATIERASIEAIPEGRLAAARLRSFDFGACWRPAASASRRRSGENLRRRLPAAAQPALLLSAPRRAGPARAPGFGAARACRRKSWTPEAPLRAVPA